MPHQIVEDELEQLERVSERLASLPEVETASEEPIVRELESLRDALVSSWQKPGQDPPELFEVAKPSGPSFEGLEGEARGLLVLLDRVVAQLLRALRSQDQRLPVSGINLQTSV